MEPLRWDTGVDVSDIYTHRKTFKELAHVLLEATMSTICRTGSLAKDPG